MSDHYSMNRQFAVSSFIESHQFMAQPVCLGILEHGITAVVTPENSSRKSADWFGFTMRLQASLQSKVNWQSFTVSRPTLISRLRNFLSFP